MKPEHFAVARKLFEAVVELPDAERAPRLRAITEVPGLAEEVLALCRANDAGVTTRFSQPRDAMLRSAVEAAAPIEPGDTFGPWRIVREIGRGGMGSVYLVERSDGHYTQTAALKFVRGIPQASTLAYFTRERQLLAELTHPNVARLLDGGATPLGQPYLVMEYVDGLHVDDYCRKHSLDIRPILALFAAACDAVAFAHRQLIVHCDLKPSNVLVNRDGRPMLLDFGIAQLVGRVDAARLDESSAPPPAPPAFTPRYASPEQRESGTVSTASDVYSLGVMLGELLGTPCPAELQAIVAKATRTDPAQRYASVDAFTGDIDRYLRKLPVQAMPSSPLYSARKWLARRWPVALAGAAFLATVAGFTARVMSESRRALDAEQQALVERDRARQTSDFLVSVFDSSIPNAETSDIPASRLLAAAEARIDKDLAGQPATQAELFRTVAAVQQGMGNPKQARADYLRSVEIERTLNRPLELARTLYELGMMRITYFNATEAEPDVREALKLREEHAAPNSLELAQSLSGYAHVISDRNQYDEAEKIFARAEGILAKLRPLGAAHKSLYIQYAQHSMRTDRTERGLEQFRTGLEINAALHGREHPEYLDSQELYIRALKQVRRFDEAEKLARSGLALRRKQDGDETENVASAVMELARLVQANGRPRDSIPLYQEASAIRAKRTGKDSTLYAVAQNNLGMAYFEMDDLPRAEAVMEESYRVARKGFAPDDTSLAVIRNNLGRVCLMGGKLEQARSHLMAVLDVRVSRLGEKHVNTVESRLSIAELHRRAGETDKALAQLGAVRALLPTGKPMPQVNHDRILGLVRAGQGRTDEAVDLLARADAARLKALGERDLEAWLHTVDRLELLVRRNAPGDRATAAELARTALDKVRPQVSPASPRAARLKQVAAAL